MLGYKSSKTTEIYTHMSERNIVAIRSPLDEIMAVGRVESRKSDRVELANSSSDISPAGTDSRTRVENKRVKRKCPCKNLFKEGINHGENFCCLLQ